ncbi:DUF5819 family protein [Streptomyces sp. URMC 129]|uniref:DUF5819 family protein n=1 Tax=Streptomyces sp. URMC 129 TaxID=3423407 RepID=UPI003F1D8127
MEPTEPSARTGDARAGAPRFSALPPAARAVIAVAAAAVALVTVAHMAALLFFVAPEGNTAMEQQGDLIRDWVEPEFAQNWKLFAPEPTTTNVHVQVRAEIRGVSGPEVTEWIDLTARTQDDMRYHPLPSKTMNTQLRRACAQYLKSHEADGTATSGYGTLTEIHLYRLALQRIDGDVDPDTVESLQVRLERTRPPAMPWTDDSVSRTPEYTEMDWRPVGSLDLSDDDGTEEASS